MKKLIKRIIPLSILNKYRRHIIVKQFEKYYAYDKKLFIKHTNILYQDTQLKCIGKIVHTYHVIEKGLTMPDMKPGFGKERMILLINECLNYQRKYDNNKIQFLHALGVIEEYNRVHSEINFTIDKELQSKIDVLLEKAKHIPFVEQIITRRDVYFVSHNAPFDKFSESRKSVRNFEGKIELTQISKAIELAQNTPSACNRQPSRVHIIENSELIAKAFEIQNGNRGFGHLANKLIIVTADLSAYQVAEERNCAFVDGGMYAMNLLYALHFNKIAVCPLNWCSSPTEDLKLRDIITIPDSEIIILLIACGNLPEKFKLAASKRNDYKEIINIH